MKRTLLITFFLINSLGMYAQESKDELRMMIDSAVSFKYHQMAGAPQAAYSDHYHNNLYLIDAQDRPLDYLNASRKLPFKFMDVYDSRNAKLVKKGIYAWKVVTALNKQQVVIDIIDFYITLRGKNYNFANGGGTKLIFEYSCDENKWKMTSASNQGV